MWRGARGSRSPCGTRLCVYKFMGFFKKLVSNINKATTRKTCKVMISSYNRVKNQYPSFPQKELYALTLLLRSGWKRMGPSLYVFTRGSRTINIEENDKLKDVVENVAINELMPKPRLNREVFVENFEFFQEITNTIKEEFKNLKNKNHEMGKGCHGKRVSGTLIKRRVVTMVLLSYG